MSIQLSLARQSNAHTYRLLLVKDPALHTLRRFKQLLHLQRRKRFLHRLKPVSSVSLNFARLGRNRT
jgi:hypothetical protein